MTIHLHNSMDSDLCIYITKAEFLTKESKNIVVGHLRNEIGKVVQQSNTRCAKSNCASKKCY